MHVLQQVVDGITSGSIYGAVALALVLVYRSTGMINFAQGQLAAVSAYVAYSLTKSGLPVVAAIIVATLASAALGAALERTLIRRFERADHLVTGAGYTANAGILKASELDEQIAKLKAKCPTCGETKFSPAARQNLMNATEIGPGSGRVGYLRPETAQGIFTDYPLLYRHFREKLPFGVVQLGGSNRNEISPRPGMLRLREFSLMEAEVFYDPAATTHPRFGEVATRKPPFIPHAHEQNRETPYGPADTHRRFATEGASARADPHPA